MDLDRDTILDMIGAGHGRGEGVFIPFLFVEWLGSYEAAALLNQILYWRDVARREGKAEFYHSYADWRSELHLTERQVRGGLERVRALGVQTTARRAPNGDRTLFYVVDAGVFLAALQAFLSDGSVQNVPTGPYDGVRADEDDSYGRSNEQNTTTETTTERETPPPAAEEKTTGRPIHPHPKQQALNGSTGHTSTDMPPWFSQIPAILLGRQPAPPEVDPGAWERLRAWVPERAPNVNLESETEALVDWAAANPAKARKSDWLAFWRTCVRKKQEELAPEARRYHNALARASPAPALGVPPILAELERRRAGKGAPS